jgi:two-component system chemotaxis response regulator CheB
MKADRIDVVPEKIRVLIGEDSSFMRRMISDTLETDPDITVAGTAGNGHEVLRKLVELQPDVVTLDLEMPHMDGLETLRFIMSEWPTPVVILSGHTAEGARMALTCLEYGAVDFVAKTAKGTTFPAEELISTVKLASTVDAEKVRFAPTDFDLKTKTGQYAGGKPECIVLIGASTGGPQALMEVVPRLPADLPAAVVVVQHMPASFTTFFAERLDARSALVVQEAKDGETMESGRVLVAPGGSHLMLEERGGDPVVMLLPRNERHRTACPSIDFAMTSMASVLRRRLVGVVLTGMGRDGEAGCVAIRRYGGTVICQDRETSMIFGMPGAVIASGLANEVVSVDAIAGAIERAVERAIAGAVIDAGR